VRSRKRRALARATGRCTTCYKRKVRQYAICAQCRKEAREYLRSVRDRRYRVGICTQCNGRQGHPDPGKRLCRTCIEGMYPRQVALRRAWRRSGRCTRCGKRRAEPRLMCSRCSELQRKRARQRSRQLRQDLLERYGNRCRCCGESRSYKFLTLDHVNNDGYLERRTVSSPVALYRRILQHSGISSRYQLLCWNCNMAKAHYGRCPHQTSRRTRGPALAQAGGRQSTVA